MIQHKTFMKGEIIIQEKDYGEEIFILDMGEVEVSKETDGRRIVLGTLGAGELFGEMSVIDEKPRSATVQALRDCHVKVLHRDQFLEVLQMDREISVKILRSLFNRLRRANMRGMQASHPPVAEIIPSEVFQKPSVSLTLEGLTPKASQALPATPYAVDAFPFLIGRVTSDPFAHQDLAISDSRPFQLSRHHLVFERGPEGIYATDMGSRLGFQVGGRRYGGREDETSSLLSDGDILVLGGGKSVFQYRIALA
jgi:hypothetical protein